jgi:tetratricopeptide (TPR) repeat protein
MRLNAAGEDWLKITEKERSMALVRLSQFLAAAAFLAGGNIAEAGMLPASQPPETHEGLQPRTDESDAQALGDLYLLTCFTAVVQGGALEGEKACTRAIALDPGKTDAYELRGYAYLLQHRFERAAVDFQIVLRSRPKDPDDLAGYGRALSGLGEFEAAVTQFTAAVAAAPKDASIRSGLCWARGGTGKNLAQALADCNVALSAGRAIRYRPGQPRHGRVAHDPLSRSDRRLHGGAGGRSLPALRQIRPQASASVARADGSGQRRYHRCTQIRP